jgi:Winged helix DNA-binding domain
VPAAARVLTQRQLNRALLARQMLLERARTPIGRTLERMGGLQAQYAPSMYIGLWSRMDGFERDALTSALERRTVVQATLMRATIHLVSRADYWPFELGVKRARAEWSRRVASWDASPAKLRAAAAKLRRALDGGSLQRKEIEELLGKETARIVGMELDLVRVPPAGTWERRRADLYAAAEDWLGPPPDGLTEEGGIALLVRRYLGAFGPSTRVEVADWAGLPLALVEPDVERLATRRFRAEDGAELVDLPRGPLPEPDTPAPVRFLPTWDAALLAHARRSGILHEEHRPRIFNTKMPQSIGTFLVDGSVAGTWKLDGGRIRTEPFTKLDLATRRELDDEAERLAGFHG